MENFNFQLRLLAKKSVEQTVKNAAHLGKDQATITAITGIDLIANQFSKHQTCYVNYTRIAREAITRKSSSETDVTGDFRSACHVIEKLV